MTLQDPDSGFAERLVETATYVLRLASAHDVTGGPVAAATKALAEILRHRPEPDEAVRLTSSDGDTFVDGTFLRPTVETAAWSAMLSTAFASAAIESVTFEPGCEASELRSFVAAVREVGQSPRATPLAARSFERVSVLPQRRPSAVKGIDTCVDAIAGLFGSVRAAREAAIRGDAIPMGPLRRDLRHLANAVAPHGSCAFALARSLPEGIDRHAVVSTVLVSLVGERLSLDAAARETLALSAALHEIAGDTREAVRRTVSAIGRSGAALPLARVAAIAADPILPPERTGADPVARLVALSCSYERMISGESPLAHEDAIRRLLRSVDPAFARILAEVVGFHPPGSVVHLSDGSVGVVLLPPRAPEQWAQPTVRVLRDAAGRPADRTIDLLAIGSWIVESLPGVSAPHAFFQR